MSVAYPSHPSPFESSPIHNIPLYIQPPSLFPKLITVLPLKGIPSLLTSIIHVSISLYEDVLCCVLHAEPEVSQ